MLNRNLFSGVASTSPRGLSKEGDGSYKFLVVFRPKTSWADEVYLGNLLIEVLGQVANMTGAFEFDVIKADEKKE